MRPIVIGLIFLHACGSGTGPDQVAKRFVKHYYVETNLTEASHDCDGLALQKVKNSQTLVSGQIIDQGTRRPKIFYDLLEAKGGSTESSEEATYLFRVTIQPPDFPEMVRNTSLKLRRRESGWKVTQFSDYE